MNYARRHCELPVSPIAFECNIAHIVPAKIRRIAIVFTYPDRDEEREYPGSTKFHKLDRDAIIKFAVRAYSAVGMLQSDKDTCEYCLPRTLADVLAFVEYHFAGDGEYANCEILKPSDYRKRQEKKERDEVESIAASICRTYKVQPGTVEFIRAARKHYKKTTDREHHYRNDGESRAERFAMYDDKNNFYNDNDYSSGIEHSARAEYARLLRYLRKHTPLLMAQYKEWKLSRKKKA